MYDYLIVGSGLYGSVFAHEANKAGKTCLVLEKKEHIGGNIYTRNVGGIHVHEYGPHIFHTSSKKIWDYVNQFATFNNFVNRPKVDYKGKVYSFPINLLTLYQLWGVKTPEEAIEKLLASKVKIDNPQNLEEWCLNEIGTELYETFIKGYTQKQWKTDPKELPTFIIKRIPIRTNFDDNYYFDTYQGIPVGGYTQIIEKMLSGIEVKLNTDYLANKESWDKVAKKVLYTGPIDAYFNYQFGDLDYRTTSFEHEMVPIKDYQGNALINYTDVNVPYTRIIEHKHFDPVNVPHTLITREYPEDWKRGLTPYYPINNEKNTKIYNQYRELTKTLPNVLFGGRLAEYKYYDMHQVIAAALHDFEKENTGILNTLK
jgi:UDP-galactopyranose mutase